MWQKGSSFLTGFLKSHGSEDPEMKKNVGKANVGCFQFREILEEKTVAVNSKRRIFLGFIFRMGGFEHINRLNVGAGYGGGQRQRVRELMGEVPEELHPQHQGDGWKGGAGAAGTPIL